MAVCVFAYFWGDTGFEFVDVRFDVCSEYKYIHLTNYCQQKHAPSFEKFEAGNTLSFEDFEQYLANSVPKGVNALQDVIMPQIKRFICDTFLALQGPGGRCVLPVIIRGCATATATATATGSLMSFSCCPCLQWSRFRRKWVREESSCHPTTPLRAAWLRLHG